MSEEQQEVELRASILESGAIRLRVERSHHPLANFEAVLTINKEDNTVDIASNLEVVGSYKGSIALARWLRAIIGGYGLGKDPLQGGK